MEDHVVAVVKTLPNGRQVVGYYSVVAATPDAARVCASLHLGLALRAAGLL